MFAHKAALVIAAASSLCAGVAAQFTSVPMPQVPWTTSQFGSGQAVADFDGDGDMDIVIATSTGGPLILLRNDGNWSFTNVGFPAQLGLHPHPLCLVAADVDNDGDQDLYVGGHFVAARLYINDGAGVFSDQAVARGIVHADDNYAASFGDFDRDGWLDLYLGNRSSTITTIPAENRLYRNTGDGHFVDVTAQAGVAGNGLTFVVAFIDYDEDGWPDLLDIRDKGTPTVPNEMFRNLGDGTFSAVGAQIGVNMPVDGMGADFLDAFNDGGVDFFCTDGQPSNLFHVWDPTTSTYSEVAAALGMQGTNNVVWACNFLDIYNDGWQDIFTVVENAPNNLYLNPCTPLAAAQPWLDIAPSVGLATARTQFCASTGDFDDDGRVDVLNHFNVGGILHPNGIDLLANHTASGNWIKLRATGRVSNRDGLGARFEVTTAGHTQRQAVRSGVGFQSSSDPRLHFGLGSAATVDEIHVRWPSGQYQHLSNVPANQILNVLEPIMTSSGPTPVGGSSTVSMSIPGDEGLSYMMLLSFSNQTGITLGSQTLPIDFDALTAATLDPSNPFFVGSIGTLDAAGNGSATLNVPPFPALSGVTIFAGGLTVDPNSPTQVRTVIHAAVALPIQ
ncbi:MAG: CRTAC1 family protein [Planctomycetota bacterium]|nr:CRTAC1 family protein [Planctomycetota bacterium]